jgi:hypothetical protein
MPNQPTPATCGPEAASQPQTCGVHGGEGGGGGGGGAGQFVPSSHAPPPPAPSPASPTTAAAAPGGSVPGRVAAVPSHTYGGLVRTAAVLEADGSLRLLARPQGPSASRVRAALQLLHLPLGSAEAARLAGRALEAGAR